MVNCYKFNQNLDLISIASTNDIGNNFLQNCYDMSDAQQKTIKFGDTITVSSQQRYNNVFCTDKPNCSAYQDGIKISSNKANEIKNCFVNLNNMDSTHPGYRNLK
jgi:hypothetical protein